MKSKKVHRQYRVILVVDAGGWTVEVHRPDGRCEALIGAVTPAEAAGHLQERVREGAGWRMKLAAEQHTATVAGGGVGA